MKVLGETVFDYAKIIYFTFFYSNIFINSEKKVQITYQLFKPFN